MIQSVLPVTELVVLTVLSVLQMHFEMTREHACAYLITTDSIARCTSESASHDVDSVTDLRCMNVFLTNVTLTSKHTGMKSLGFADALMITVATAATTTLENATLFVMDAQAQLTWTALSVTRTLVSMTKELVYALLDSWERIATP